MHGKIILQSLLAYAVAVLVAFVTELMLGWGSLRPTLLLSLGTLPSTAGYVISAAVYPSRRWPRHLWFAAPAGVLIASGVVWTVTGDWLVRSIGQSLLLCFALQLINVYMVLLLTAGIHTKSLRQRSAKTAGAKRMARESTSSARS